MMKPADCCLITASLPLHCCFIAASFSTYKLGYRPEAPEMKMLLPSRHPLSAFQISNIEFYLRY